MTTDIAVTAQPDPTLEQFLADRLYEFNAAATGIDDGLALTIAVRDDQGQIVAGLTGHTWGGCCEIVRLWVHESQRSRGLGTRLVRAAEAEAVRRGCDQMVLSTHSFQAPSFYERLGFCRVASVADYPSGHANIVMTKQPLGAAAA